VPGIGPSLLGSIPLLEPAPAESVHPSIKEQLEGSAERDADLVVIGSGPAGYVGAIRAAQLGAKVVIVEKNSVGGTCLNVGCIPTKVLLACVAVLESVKNGSDFGVNVKGFDVDLAAMMSRKSSVVKRLVGGVEALLKSRKIRIVRGDGRRAGGRRAGDPHGCCA
jgi:dihydrolipoamide dehydrogenase